MSFALDKVVLWGRSYDEYVHMFALTGADLAGRILGCSDGPASLNAEATRRNQRVISCDPIYALPAEAINRRIRETYPTIVDQLRQNLGDYRWDTFASPDDLGKFRMAAMRRFLEDYPQGRAEGRYLDASLPALPFEDKTFDLALCSHFLFLYSEQLSFDFHLAAIRELCRVAREVRIYPLLTLAVTPSPHVEPIRAALEADGRQVRLVRVPYEFQRGARSALCVGAPEM